MVIARKSKQLPQQQLVFLFLLSGETHAHLAVSKRV
jgi:hypothetical protein